MRLLGKRLGDLGNILETRARNWVTEHVPRNRSRYRARGVVTPGNRESMNSDGAFTPVFDEVTLAPTPREIYDKSSDFMRLDEYVDTESAARFHSVAGAWRVPEGRIYTNQPSCYYVLDRDNRILTDISYRYQDALDRVPEEELRLTAKYFPEPERIGGAAANLVLGGGPAINIYHWMIDALPRLRLIEEIRPLSEIDAFLVQGTDSGFRLRSLELLGIDPARVRFFDRQLIHIQADELLSGSAPRGRVNIVTPRWAIRFLRERYLKAIEPSQSEWPDKIYISRRDSSLRGVENEEEVIAQLEERGYREILLSQYSFDDKIALFHNAREIVAMNGAGLGFLLFCQPDSRLLELHPAGYINYAMSNLATQVGMEYRYLIIGEADTGKSGYDAQRQSLVVDPGALKEKMQGW